VRITESVFWVSLAFVSALCAGSSSIFAKMVSSKADNDIATAIRSVVIVVLMWAVAIAVGDVVPLSEIPFCTLFYVIVSGLCLGVAWLIFFRALSVGDANKVVPVDRTSTVMAMLLSFVFLGESVNVYTVSAMLLITVGTALMIHAGVRKGSGNKMWLVLAVLSAFFTALSSVLGKPGADAIDPLYATAIRASMFFLVAWLVVFIGKGVAPIRQLDNHDRKFIVLSGIATGLSWMCFYTALKYGPASIVTPIDKLSLVVVVVLSYFILHEKVDRKSIIGLAIILAGTMCLLFSV
jgi:transporter family protein